MKDNKLGESHDSQLTSNPKIVRTVASDDYPLSDPRSSIWKGTTVNCAVVVPCQPSWDDNFTTDQCKTLQRGSTLSRKRLVIRQSKPLKKTVAKKKRNSCTPSLKKLSQTPPSSSHLKQHRFPRLASSRVSSFSFTKLNEIDLKSDSSSNSDFKLSDDESRLVNHAKNSEDEDYVDKSADDDSFESVADLEETDSENFMSHFAKSPNMNPLEIDNSPTDLISETLDPLKDENQRHRSSTIESNCEGKTKALSACDLKDKAKPSVAKKYTDCWRGFKLGFDVSGAPLATIDEIFEHLTSKFISHPLFPRMIKHLKGRPIRVATMCSGTECPIIAMDFIRDSEVFNFEHVFSVEIEPFKQAYISRNYPGLLVFRDICELARSYTANKMATTALGALAPVPENIDLLVTGFCCVDFSNLNNNPKTLLERGESGDTFCAAVAFIMKGKPKIVIFENVSGAPWSDKKLRKDQKSKIRAQYLKNKNKKLNESELDDLYEMLVQEERISEGIDITMEKAGYSTQLMKMDTKDYYLPQTRQRGYMICIRNDILGSTEPGLVLEKTTANARSQLAKLANCVSSFKHPATVSCETMLLAVFDETAVPVERLEEIDDEKDKNVAWVRSAEEHSRYRSDLGLGTSRKLTSWSESGWRLLPDFYSPIKAFTERVLDCLEVAHLRNILRGFDDRYYSRMLELSQNCFRATDITKTGIMPCLTPSGIPFWSSEGRRLTGRETLTLQGIPVHRIDLSFLTESHLRDLTGNAMSSTAVGVCIISSLLIFSKYLNPRDGGHGATKEFFSDFNQEEDLYQFQKNPEVVESILSVSDALKNARSSVKLCWCEKRDEILNRKFKICSVCQHTICQLHAGNPKHEYKIMNATRASPFKFERLLRLALPKKINLQSVGDMLRAAKFLPKKIQGFDHDELENYYFKALQSEMFFLAIKRSDVWEVMYESLAAKYILCISTTTVQWLLYAKPSRSLSVEHPVRQYLERFPIARMKPHSNDITKGIWSFWVPEKRSVPAKITWIGKLLPSFKNDRGLVDDHDVEIFSTWRIQADTNPDIPDISGDYHLQRECGRAMNSLHVRKESSTHSRLFLFLDHEKKTGDYRNHSYIFCQDTRNLEYGVSQTIVARLPAWVGEPEVKKIPTDFYSKYMLHRMHPLQKPSQLPNSKLSDEPPVISIDSVDVTSDGFWQEIPDQNITQKRKPSREKSTINYGHLQNPRDLQTLETDSCQHPRAVFTCKTKIPAYIAKSFHRGIWNTVSTKNARDVFFFLYCFLSDGLVIPDYIEEREEWHEVRTKELNRCTLCAPLPPPILWHLNAKQMPKPFEHLAHACNYERELKDRPATMSQVFKIDDQNILTFKVGISFQSLIHRAASVFELGEVTASWRLITDNLTMTRPSMPKFKIKDTKDMIPIKQWENKDYPLRPEQQRSIAWQIKSELDAEAFTEEEMVEDGIPQLGYQVLVKASRRKLVLGGLLAHEVGFGKTVIVLALIYYQTKFDRAWGERTSTKRIHSKATVIFVPLSLTTQWLNEISKFLPHITKVITIRNMKDLRQCTIEDISNADIIIVNSSILQCEGYLFDLSQFAGMLAPDWMASSRAKKSWHDTAIKSIPETLHYLKNKTSDLTSYLNQKLNKSRLEAENAERPYPSKRYAGRQYMENKIAKRSKNEDQTEQPEKIDPGSRMRKVEGKEKSLLGNTYPTKPQKWTSMTHVVFEMFSFARIVVDEYHYLTPGQIISIAAIDSQCRWLLSATPLLDTFEQFKQVGELLGIYLGREDFSTMAPEIFKSRVSDMTVSERFLAFDKPSSPAWLRARYNQMQIFLDTFVRKDLAELSAFDTDESIHLVHQPVAERAFYLELEQLLADNQFQIPRTRSKNSEGEYQVQVTLGKFKLAEQALLNGASFYNVQAYDLHKESLGHKSDAIDILLKNRRLDLKAIQATILRDLQRAEWLQVNFSECSIISNYRAFKTMVMKIGAKDPQSSEILRNLLKKAENNVQNYDWRRDFLEPRKSASGEGKNKSAILPYPSGFILDQGKRVSAPTRYLRTTVSSLDNAVKRLTKLVRALRYAENVKACSRLTLSEELIRCMKCSVRLDLPENAIILGSCGHMMCTSCVSGIAGYCPVEMCGAAFQIHQQLSGTEFVVQHRSLDDERFGTKTADLIRYLEKVPKNEKVLLFVQEETAIERITTALSQADLAFVLLGGRNPASIIENFQKRRPMNDRCGGPKVERSILILNIGDSSAAGSNLTIANHVIFFAPYFTTGTSALQKFNHAMEQGIGRAVRYGQTKKVYITHFLTSRTHDVDLFEHRKRCRVSTQDSGNPNRACIARQLSLDQDMENDEQSKTEHSSLTWFLHEHL